MGISFLKCAKGLSIDLKEKPQQSAQPQQKPQTPQFQQPQQQNNNTQPQNPTSAFADAASSVFQQTFQQNPPF